MNKYLIAFLFILTSVQCQAQNIGGIGAQLIMDTTGGWTMPRIFSLVPGSPAYDSLRATDYIISVNDISCRNKTIEEVVALIRGEAGTMVTVTTANTKEGEAPRVHQLKRVGMNIPQPADPKDAFFANCDNAVKALKQTGATIVKTFNSDCGNYFFNFDGAAGKFHIRIIAMTDPADKSGLGFRISGKVFDNEHESEATDLGIIDSKKGVNGAAQTEGSVSFTKDCVGTIAVTIHDDNKKCHAMYVVIYK